MRPITFRNDWLYFMNFRVIGLIKVVLASKFRIDYSYKIRSHKNDLLKKSEILIQNLNFQLKYVKISKIFELLLYISQDLSLIHI